MLNVAYNFPAIGANSKGRAIHFVRPVLFLGKSIKAIAHVPCQ
jgi:hypothetical protein